MNARYEAVVRIRVRGPNHPGLDIEAIIDSGFNSYLALPAATVVALGSRMISTGRTTLADGSGQRSDVFAVEVFWDGLWQPVLAWAVGNEALAGMRLLGGHELRIEVVPGGAVEITPLP